MTKRIPLSGSVTGRPITISDSVVTPIHTSPGAQSALVRLSVMNTTGGAIVVTLDVEGVTAAFSLAANGIEHIEMAIASGDEVGMQGAAVGVRVIGYAEAHSAVS